MDDLEKSESETQDRLIELPDSLILQILSLLPMKDVVTTTILSKRWRNLWTTIPCLRFRDSDAERIRNFVDSALRFWKGNKIMEFEISFPGHFDMSFAKDVDAWVYFAIEKNVEELNILLMYEPDLLDWDNAIEGSEADIYVAPQCLNSCSSIKRLSLVGCNLRVPEIPSWKQLQFLRIDGFCFSEDSINQENVNIQSTSLRKLMIEKFVEIRYNSEGGDDEQPSTNTALRLECPNLEEFEIAGFLYVECVLTNVPSLTDVTLRFDGFLGDSNYYDDHGMPGELLLGVTLRQIFSAIQHVEKVTLSDWCVQVLGAPGEKYLVSSLPNVKCLKLVVCYLELEDMAHLLVNFPNLKTLVIENHGFYGDEFIGFESNLPDSYLLQLRTFEITISPDIDTAIYGFMEFLLKHASMLEQMVVWAITFDWFPLESYNEVADRISSMEISSKTAEVTMCEI